MMRRTSLFVRLRHWPYTWPVLAIGFLLTSAVVFRIVRQRAALNSFSFCSEFLLLLLATGVAVFNASQGRKALRLFWSLLAVSYGLWAFNRGVWIYYVVVLGVKGPSFLVAMVPLFLHIVLLIAAVDATARWKLPRRPLYRLTLNNFLLVLFWIFLYAFLFVPYSGKVLPSGNLDAASRFLSLLRPFEVVYLSQNLLLLIVLGVSIAHARPTLRRIYWQLLDAFAIYALSLLALNVTLALTRDLTSWWALLYEAAVCWMVWVPLLGYKLAPELADPGQSERSGAEPAYYAWIPALLALITMPVLGISEFYRRAGESSNSQIVRLVIALVAGALFACVLFLREYRTIHKLASEVLETKERLVLAMQSSKSVAWEWDVKTGQVRSSGDLHTMFGILADSYMGRFEDFRRPVLPEDKERVQEALQGALQNHQMHSAEFRWLCQMGAYGG